MLLRSLLTTRSVPDLPAAPAVGVAATMPNTHEPSSSPTSAQTNERRTAIALPFSPRPIGATITARVAEPIGNANYQERDHLLNAEETRSSRGSGTNEMTTQCGQHWRWCVRRTT